MKYVSVVLSLLISISISVVVVMWDVQFSAEFGLNKDLALAMFIQMEAIYIFFPYIRAMSLIAQEKKRGQVFSILSELFKQSLYVDLLEEIVSRILSFFKWFASDKALLVFVFFCIISPASLQVSKKFVEERANKSSGISESPTKLDDKILTELNSYIYKNDVEIKDLKTVDEDKRNYYQINKLNEENKVYSKQRTQYIQDALDYPAKLATYNDKVANKNTNAEKDKVTWFFDYFTIFFSFIFVIVLQYGSYKVTQKGAYNIGLIVDDLKVWNKNKKEKPQANTPGIFGKIKAGIFGKKNDAYDDIVNESKQRTNDFFDSANKLLSIGTPAIVYNEESAKNGIIESIANHGHPIIENIEPEPTTEPEKIGVPDPTFKDITQNKP